VSGGPPADAWQQRFERERAARKEAERLLDARSGELWEANQALMARASELAASLERLELARTALVEQEKLAALGGLVAGVAHEINTPLGVGLTALTHGLERLGVLEQAAATNQLTRGQLRGFMADLREALSLAQANLERGAALVRSFKMVAVDQVSAERRLVDIPTLVGDILASVRPMLRKAGVKAEVRGTERLPAVLAAGAFIQVLTNLLQNACVHAFSAVTAQPDLGGPEVRKVTVTVEDDGDALEVSLVDNGHGMPPEVRARVFEPFFTTKRGEGGTGLGMHIVHNLVVNGFGGTIACTTAPGSGTTWTLRLPFGTTALARQA
jgi:two-component system NtrC family sensor kinase